MFSSVIPGDVYTEINRLKFEIDRLRNQINQLNLGLTIANHERTRLEAEVARLKHEVERFEVSNCLAWQTAQNVGEVMTTLQGQLERAEWDRDSALIQVGMEARSGQVKTNSEWLAIGRRLLGLDAVPANEKEQ